ncbi:MAG TPA: GNAT family N-acetyltransferase [Flavipsychrobacter sp.]|nr:GNAT family N-acetyltransferase [Flavipsychrobacter sp.]
MNEITYHQADAGDIELLIDTRIRFLLELAGAQPEENILALRSGLRRYFEEHVPNGTYCCWYAKAQNEVIAVGGMAIRQHPGNFQNVDGRRGYIMNMFTAASYRRQGIASELLKYLIATARKMGIHSFELHATKMGEPVYQKIGFKLHDEPTYRMWEAE